MSKNIWPFDHQKFLDLDEEDLDLITAEVECRARKLAKAGSRHVSETGPRPFAEKQWLIYVVDPDLWDEVYEDNDPSDDDEEQP